MTVETFAILFLLAGVLLFAFDRKHRVAWGFVAGVGVGALIAATWIYMIIDRMFP